MVTSYRATPDHYNQDRYFVSEIVDGWRVSEKCWTVTASATGEQPLIKDDSDQTTVPATSALGREIMGAIGRRERDPWLPVPGDRSRWASCLRVAEELDPGPPSPVEVLEIAASHVLKLRFVRFVAAMIPLLVIGKIWPGFFDSLTNVIAFVLVMFFFVGLWKLFCGDYGEWF